MLYGRKEQVAGRELLLETEKSRIGQLHRKAECVRNKIPACGTFLAIVQLLQEIYLSLLDQLMLIHNYLNVIFKCLKHGVFVIYHMNKVPV